MKTKFLIISLLSLAILTGSASAQNNFDAFWTKFKIAVKKKDKAAVSSLSVFPVGMPYGQSAVKKASFLRRYETIFNGEANAAKCFEKAKPQKDNAKTYSVYCPFKDTPNDWENTPIKYIFELTGSGWKFTALDNINE